MSSAASRKPPETWIVGTADDSGLVTQCLLVLADRFELPATVAIAHEDRFRAERDAASVANLLAFVDGPCPSAPAGEILREQEATAVVSTRCRLAEEAIASRVAAVTLDRSHPEPVDKAVRLAVTTLIDWGHEVIRRTDDAESGLRPQN